MKIGIVIPDGFDQGGGRDVVPVFLRLAESLTERHDVHVFTLRQHPETRERLPARAKVYNVGDPGGERRGFALVNAVIKTLREEHARGQFDVLHGLDADTAGLTAAFAGRLLKTPSIVTVSGGELAALPEIGYGGQLTWKGRLTIELALRLATSVTCAAEFTRKKVLGKRPDARLIILGADTSRFSPPESRRPGPPWHLMHVASLSPVKDQPTLLKAFRIIHSAEPATHMSIVGADMLGDSIQHMARLHDLDEAVTFHGSETGDAVAKMLRTADLLLSTSLFEDAGPMAFLEASACAVPTVGTAVGLIDDLSPTCATAVPVGDYEALAQSALDLLRNETQRADLGRRALDFARDNDASCTVGQFEALYQELAGKE
jgi:glycosyltransferase involved in cell wall biosynthesis